MYMIRSWSKLIHYLFIFQLQSHLTALWRYMYHMYQLDAFTQSCPADQDIINHYKLQQVNEIQYYLLSIQLKYYLFIIIQYA